MSSISDPGNHSNDAIAPTESQMDVAPSDRVIHAAGQHELLASEHDVDVWRLGVPSHHGTSEPEYMSTSAGTSKCVQRDIPMNPGTEGGVVLLQSSKCRFREADFSRSLRRGLYEKEEALNKLRKQAGRQGRFNMQSQIDKLQVTRMTEIETRVQEEVTRLRSTLQAEKERELANIEQRYARLKKPAPFENHLDIEMDSPAGPCPTRPQASTPSTPHLDAIKRIRKCRGVSKRTRLIGVDIDDNGAESGSTLSEGHEEETGGKAAPGTLDDQPDPPPVSAMVEAVTKSVETTLRTILESGNHFSVGAIPRIPRRTPRRRRQENYKIQIEKATEPTHHRDFILAEVRRLFKEKLGIAQDIDFITHISADAADVYAYEHEDGPGPDTDKIAFDLAQNHSSPWNTFILGFLLREFQLRCDRESWPIRKDDDYIQEILQERYKRLRTLWRNAQPKLTAKGLIETPAEHEARLVEESQRLGKESRQATRRRNKYHRRKTVLDRIVAMKSEDPDDDLRSWKWLQRLINTLGEHGMSSEESSVENGIENVLRVKNLEWRKNINKELEIVDLQRVVDKDIFCSQGAKPLPRKRAPDNPNSSRVPLTGLPTALYDDMWISQLTELQRESLKISKDPFPWMKLVAT
ncbi:hypothetical protein EDC04DRAFT_2615937 [Pisolithus marmoratus]|nr:hypothetical protein EDC04DRAFT_2615937 [Pisolithus marmoratus]